MPTARHELAAAAIDDGRIFVIREWTPARGSAVRSNEIFHFNGVG
jgi:hypothetical protein